MGTRSVFIDAEPEDLRNNPHSATEMKGLICWRGRTKSERYLALGLTTVLFVTILLSLTLASFWVSPALHNGHETISILPKPASLLSSKEKTVKSPNGEAKDICLTEGCVAAANEINSRMNKNADPCSDFFEFACGKFVEKSIIPDEKSALTMFSVVNDELQQKLRLLVEESATDLDSDSTKMVKNMYKSCMDTEKIAADGLKPIKDIHNALGGWPVVLGESWDEISFSWIENNYKHRRLGYSIDYFFDFSVSTDIRNSSWRMIWLDQTGMGMSREYLIKGLNDSDVRAYLKYSTEVAVLMGAERVRAEKEMLDVLQFQIDVAKIAMPREERRNMTKLYNTMSMAELQKIVPEIPWVEYTNRIFAGIQKVDETERIGISNQTYFTELMKIMKRTPKRTISNYMLWRVTSASISYLTEDVRKLQFDYSKALTGKTTRPPRWKECMGIVTGKLSYAVSNLYVKTHFKEEAKNNSDELVRYIRDEFDKILDEIDWMDSETKTQAKLKAKAIKAHIGYPKELLMDEKLNEHYGKLQVLPDNLLLNMRTVGIFGTNNSFSKLREKVDKLEWKRHASVAIVNAFYSSLENSIKFPAGILQGVFFDSDRPKYLNFGGIGYVIGHEITHGFDDQGKQFNADGNLVNWWNKETENSFLEKAKCIIQQYGNYTAPENNLKLNGINTQGENIADNGGLKEAYRAYQQYVRVNGREPSLPSLSNYTPNQLFWVSAAQVWCSKYRPQSLKLRILTGVHSPGRFRVIGPMGNSPEFAKDWSCPIGSKMNPKRKCTVW